ncbi:MAG: hypothetical protein QF681_09320 [Vicinamibacterales bacterium]|mgnify:FL=1|jgi:hypothetical protein|nr:hypothetical protein [Vicinamibacterales bacterium]
MRDFIAGLIALGLFLFALGLASTLRFHRLSRDRKRRELLAAGRTVLAEIPTSEGLTLFTADTDHFYSGDTTIAKNDIRLVKVLINGSPIASYIARRSRSEAPGHSGSFADRPEGIAHDRWDVLVRTGAGDTLVECGSIRERVSQELARSVFDAVKTDMENRDATADANDRPPTAATTPAL